jgi:hypothetical protein
LYTTGKAGEEEKETEMTAKKFSNLVAKTLGITFGPAVGQDAVWRAVKGKNAYIKDEKDNAFLIVNLPNWQAVKLLEAGFVATAKIAPKGWYSDEAKVELYWSAN